MSIESFVGPHARIPIVIRDDDTNFFTRPKMLDTLYSQVWKDGFKVSLSVVPNQRGIDDGCIPPEVRKTRSDYPISGNRELLKFLKTRVENKSIEILQHGFYHKNMENGRGEFSQEPNAKINIENGRRILRDVFDIEPKFFVPPFDDISETNLDLVVKIGMIPIYRNTKFDIFLRSKWVPHFMKSIVFKAVMKKYSNLPILPKPVHVNLGKRAISWSLPDMQFGRLKSFESLLDFVASFIESCNLSRKPICVLNHYYTYFYDWQNEVTNDELFNTWLTMMKLLSKMTNTWKTTFSELYDRQSSIENLRIAKTGSKISLGSNHFIQDFSFRINGRLQRDTNLVFDDETMIATVRQIKPESVSVFYEK
jgi:hypothetical protein